MKTKFRLSAIIVLLFITSLHYPQTITFEKRYPNIGDKGYSVHQTSDGGYVIGGYNQSNLVILKTDKDGKLEWNKEYETNHWYGMRTNPIINTTDGGYLAISTKMNTDQNIYLLKLNSVGDTVWTKVYDNNLREWGSAVVQTNDGGSIALGGSGMFTFKNAILLKTDSLGNIIWTTTFSINSTSLEHFSLAKITDDDYIIGGKEEVIKINSSGDSIWTKHFDCTIKTVNSTSDGKIIVGGEGKIEKINLSGITEWTKEIPGTVYFVTGTIDQGNILSVKEGSEKYLIKINSAADIIWRKEIRGNGNYIEETGDNGLIISGEISEDIWLLKTDSEGNHKVIEIIRPNGPGRIQQLNPYRVNWYSAGIEYVDISYSTDNGQTWQEIVSNYPIDTSIGLNYTYYIWKVPQMISDECLLKIEDSTDPLFSDQSDTLFSIYYQPYNEYDFIAINEVKMWVGNNGNGSHYPNGGRAGFYWPGGLYGVITAIYEDGLVYGGKIRGEIRANGNSWRQGLQPGNILPNGTAADPSDSTFKVWKIRNDWATFPPGSLRDEYEYDYNNWPGQLGAPYVDKDGDGLYTPGIDEPNFVGDEVLFYVANDLDPNITTLMYGSQPMGLEFQTTVWGYDREDELKDAVFKKYKIINKSNETINDMYLTYWMDDDMGNAGDDYVGCNTLLNLGYTYNSDNYDDWNYGTPPPTVGHMMLQGPIVPGEPTDSAFYNGNWISDFINLPMTTYAFYHHSALIYREPTNALEFYNYMQGLMWDGTPFVDPNTGEATIFPLSGDPVNGTGWFEGDGWPGGFSPGDRRNMISSGPFTLAPGDTQEVVYAIFMAQGSDHIQSIAELRNTANVIYNFFGIPVPTSVEKDDYAIIPSKYELYQNYPNPFNPTTTIEYSIPKQTLVELKVYDILGREVTNLVKKEQKSGKYKVEFNGHKLSSGVYFYRIKAGEFIKSKKMLLIK